MTDVVLVPDAEEPRRGTIEPVPVEPRRLRVVREDDRPVQAVPRLVVVVADERRADCVDAAAEHRDADVDLDVQVASRLCELLQLIHTTPALGFDPADARDPLHRHLAGSLRQRAEHPASRPAAHTPQRTRDPLRPSRSSQAAAVAALSATEPWPHEAQRKRESTRRLDTRLSAAFWMVTTLVALYRLGIFVSGGAPATIDSGNWLAFGEQIFGDSSRDSSITYPPLVPIIATVATALAGLTWGIAILGSLASLAPGVGLYLALRRVGLGSTAVLPAMLLLGASSVGEAAAWGGFPQLIGLGLLPLTLVAALRYVDDPSHRRALALGAWVMVSMATSHFMGIVVVMCVAAMVLTSVAPGRSRTELGAVVRTSPGLVLPSVWLIPTYVRLVDAVVFNPNEFAALDNLSWSNLLDRLELIYPGFPVLWEIVLPIAFVTPLLCWRIRTEAAWRIHTVLTVVVLCLVAATREGRYLYLFPLIGATGIGVWITQLRPAFQRLTRAPSGATWTMVAGAAAVVVIALQLQGGLSSFREHREFYGVMTPGLIEAIDVAGDAAGDGTIAVPSLGDAPIGWWVEARTDGTVIYGSPLRWLNFPDEIDRARSANAIFDPSFPAADTASALLAIDADVVIVPTRWAWFDDEAVRQWITDESVDVLFDHEDVLVIDVGSLG